MAMNAAKRKSGNIHTPKGRMVWPALFKPSLPRGEKDEEKARFQCTLLIPKGSDIDALDVAVKEAITDNVSEAKRKVTKIKTPFLKTEDYPRLADYADDFPDMIRCNAKYKPDVVSADGKRTIGEEEEADEIYSGRWAKLSVRPFWYDHPTGGKGVSFGLQNVQVLVHDEAIVGARVRGTDEFAPADDLEDLA